MKIAIIGGIGSGKSEVLKVAKQMGICCLSADEINASLLISDDYIAEIQKAFPSAVKDGSVDKAKLSAIVFSSDEEREKLNAIAHPRILACIKEEKSNPLVVEMPLLVESGAESLFDEIVLVKTPLLVRIKRLHKRGMNLKQALMRIRAQAKGRELTKIATRTLRNGGSLQKLNIQAQKLFKELTF